MKLSLDKADTAATYLQINYRFFPQFKNLLQGWSKQHRSSLKKMLSCRGCGSRSLAVENARLKCHTRILFGGFCTSRIIRIHGRGCRIKRLNVLSQGSQVLQALVGILSPARALALLMSMMP